MTILTAHVGSGQTYATMQAAWNALAPTSADDVTLYIHGLLTGEHTITGGNHPASLLVTRVGATDSALALSYAGQTGMDGFDCADWNGRALTCDRNNTTVRGLRIRVTNAEALNALRLQGSNSRAEDNIFDTAAPQFAVHADTPNAATVVGNVIVCRHADYARGIHGGWNGLTADRNTLICLGGAITKQGIANDAGTILARDNVVVLFGTNSFQGSYHASSSHNATDHSSAPGSSALTGLTPSALFENVTAGALDLRIKAGSPLIASGTTISGVTTDIFGVTIGATADRGAAEYVAAGGGDDVTGTLTASVVTTMVASGTVGAPPVTGTLAATVGVTMAASGTAATADPGRTTGPIIDPEGNLRANETGVTICLYDPTTHELVAAITGETTNATGYCTYQSALLDHTTEYRERIILSDGTDDLPEITTS